MGAPWSFGFKGPYTGKIVAAPCTTRAGPTEDRSPFFFSNRLFPEFDQVPSMSAFFGAN